MVSRTAIELPKEFAFSKSRLEALPTPADGRAEYRDANVSGLQLRVTTTGIKTFSVFRRVKGGGPERITLGRFPDISYEQAKRMAANINAAIADGANPAEVKRAHRAEMTFSELFKQYMDRHAKLKKVTFAEDQQRYEQYLERTLGAKKLSLVTRQAIAAIHSEITAAGHPVVANRVLALISSIFGRGIEFGLIDANPALGIRRNKEKDRERFMLPNELPRFFKALDAEPNETVRDYFYLSLFTGARRTNVLEMAWRELDLDHKEWRIPDTKNGTPQLIPLPDQAVQILKLRKAKADEDDIYVFPGDGRKGHLVEPRKGWLRILKEANLTNLRIHDLRRTMGSWQTRTGASPTVVGKSLNHKSAQTTLIYTRLDVDPVREAMGKATKAMLEVGKGKKGRAGKKPHPAPAPAPKSKT